MSRVAIVIGVNHTGNLPVLKAAVSGAQKFGAWLVGEGFEVYYFVDSQHTVTANAITDQITTLVDQGIVEQLVVYFSGHGFLRNYSEFWMLSEAPRNANEAISVRENVFLARECGIPSVVIISDACRSRAQSLQAERIRGSLIFPNEPVTRNVRPEIDRFFAALPGDSAFEIMVDESVKQYDGIFTHCFLQAYKEPDSEMIRQVVCDGETLHVVPNRCLKEYLRREMAALMLKKKYPGQLPDAIVESGESVYIGRSKPIKKKKRIRGRGMSVRGTIDVRDIAGAAIARVVGSSIDVPELVGNLIDGMADKSDFSESVELVGTAQRVGAGHFETETGFKIFGADVSEVLGLNMKAELLSGGDGKEPAYVRLYPGYAGIRGSTGSSVSSVILRLADGSGMVLAGLKNYIGTVIVENAQVLNVSYVPSDNSFLWDDYARERTRLEELRAVVAASARYGVFRIDQDNASEIAHQIRYLKSIDPTLGLYASYAYAEVGMFDQVRSVMDYMRGNLSSMLFDVAMLAGELDESRGPRGYPVVPFCPMLSQGWTLLRVKRVKVPSAVEEAANHLSSALWTTFNPTGMSIIFKAISEGGIL